MHGNIELRLISTMLHTGDFSPVINGDINKDTFTTESGKLLFTFITTFRGETGGAVKFPTLGIVRSRFAKSAIELPTPEPSDSIAALTHEVRAERFRTNVSEVAHDLAMSAEEPDGLSQAVENAITKLKKELLPIQHSKKASLSDDFHDVLDDYDCGAIVLDGLDYPWPSMTKATKGIHRKEFIVIAGRPKSRKTFTALAVAAHAVKTLNARVLFISPEMPPKQVLLRFIASLCGLRYTEFKDAALDETEEIRLLEAARRYGRLSNETEEQYSMRLLENTNNSSVPLFEVIQGTNKTVSWIESQIEIYRPDIVVVDSFYRLRVNQGRKNDSDWKVMTQISRELKDLAMDMNVSIIGTHQMNRGAEGKVGGLGNLALADAVSQDADLIIRVVTGKIDGAESSALVVLGGREVPFDGILINNRPCFDFSERGLITSRKQVEQLMAKDDEDEEEDEKKKKTKAKKKAAKSKINELAKNKARVTPDAFKPTEEEDEDVESSEDDEIGKD